MAATGRDLASNHLNAPEIPVLVHGGREGNILLRYDGIRREKTQAIFAIIGIEDLAKLPSDTLHGLNLAVRASGGKIESSTFAFFRETSTGIALYVDSDIHENFLDRLLEVARVEGFSILSAQGDLDLMRSPDGDILAPETPAFITNKFKPVPVDKALGMMHEARHAHITAKEAESALTAREDGPQDPSPWS